MKKIYLAAACILLAGCQAQQHRLQAEYPQLTVGPQAANYLQVESVQQGTASGDLLRAGVRFANTSNFKQTLRYRMAWMDANGFEIQGLAARWEQLELRPLEPVSISRVAPSPQARDYRIYLFDINTARAMQAQGNQR